MCSKRPGTPGWGARGIQQTNQLGPNCGVLESQGKSGGTHPAGRRVGNTQIWLSPRKGQKISAKRLLQGPLRGKRGYFPGGHSRKRRENSNGVRQKKTALTKLLLSPYPGVNISESLFFSSIKCPEDRSWAPSPSSPFIDSGFANRNANRPS